MLGWGHWTRVHSNNTALSSNCTPQQHLFSNRSCTLSRYRGKRVNSRTCTHNHMCPLRHSHMCPLRHNHMSASSISNYSNCTLRRIHHTLHTTIISNSSSPSSLLHNIPNNSSKLMVPYHHFSSSTFHTRTMTTILMLLTRTASQSSPAPAHSSPLLSMEPLCCSQAKRKLHTHLHLPASAQYRRRA